MMLRPRKEFRSESVFGLVYSFIHSVWIRTRALPFSMVAVKRKVTNHSTPKICFIWPPVEIGWEPVYFVCVQGGGDLHWGGGHPEPWPGGREEVPRHRGQAGPEAGCRLHLRAKLPLIDSIGIWSGISTWILQISCNISSDLNQNRNLFAIENKYVFISYIYLYLLLLNDQVNIAWFTSTRGGGDPSPPCVSDSVSDPDPHKEMPPGSGSAWTNADPDPGGKKA